MITKFRQIVQTVLEIGIKTSQDKVSLFSTEFEVSNTGGSIASYAVHISMGMVI